MRWSLRRMLRLALEAEEEGRAEDLMRYCEIYSLGCNRLVKLIRVRRAGRGRLRERLGEVISEAIDEVTRGWSGRQVVR